MPFARMQAWCVALMGGGVLLAQVPTAAPESPLSGPAIADRAADDSSNKRFDGSMRDEGDRPELRAIERLELSREERAAVDAVLAKRAAVMERLIKENIALLLKAQAVREGNDAEARRALGAEFREAFAELGVDGPLAEQLAGAMTPEHAEAFRTLNREYWRAQMGDGDDRKYGAALRVLGNEIKQAYERMIEDGEQRLDDVIAALQLTAEQEGKVRAIVTEFAQQTKLNPNGLQRAGLFLKVARELTAEQRERAFELIRGE